MKNKIRLISILFFAVNMHVNGQTFEAKGKGTQPNIIYIYADDLGYGEIEAYGQLKIKTPYLNKLREEGMKFTNHYTSTPVCAPARAMLLTGKNGGHSYIRGNYELGGFLDSLEGGRCLFLKELIPFLKC